MGFHFNMAIRLNRLDDSRIFKVQKHITSPLFQSTGIGGFEPMVPAPTSLSPFPPPKTTVIAQRQRAQLDFTSPFAADASSEMLVVFVSLEVS